MSVPITAFLPHSGHRGLSSVVEQLQASGLVRRIYLLATEDAPPLDGCHCLRVENLHASETIRRIAGKASTPAALLLLRWK